MRLDFFTWWLWTCRELSAPPFASVDKTKAAVVRTRPSLGVVLLIAALRLEEKATRARRCNPGLVP